MIIRWGVWKVHIDKRIVDEDREELVAVCSNCGMPLKNPKTSIYANETLGVYCDTQCAIEDVNALAEHHQESDPNWQGF